MKITSKEVVNGLWAITINGGDFELTIWVGHSETAQEECDKFNSALQSHVQAELIKMLDEWTDDEIETHSRYVRPSFWSEGAIWLRDQLMDKLK